VPETCAAREVEEEVGRRAGRLEPLGFIWTTPGFTDERIWLYLARGLRPAPQQLDADEALSVERLPLEQAVVVRPSPEHGYRMRARLHVRGRRIGFFREGTHDLCDAATTGQLLPATLEVLELLQSRLGRDEARSIRELELGENVPATERALLVEIAPGTAAGDAQRLPRSFDVAGVTGFVVTRPEAPQFVAGRGHPHVSDALDLTVEGAGAHVRLRRHVAAFFQGNRFLLQPLVETVLGLIPRGGLIDLYAGAGLFGVSYAALGRGPVVAVEGDRQAAGDLRDNAAPLVDLMRVVPYAVEDFLVRSPMAGAATSEAGGPPNDATNGWTVRVSSGSPLTSMTSSTTMEPANVPPTTTRPWLSSPSQLVLPNVL